MRAGASRRISTRSASRTAPTGSATSSPPCRATRRCRRSWSSPTWTSSGFVVRRSSPDGLIRARARSAACPSGRWRRRRCCSALGEGRDLPGVIGIKSHHATDARGEVPRRALRASSLSTPASRRARGGARPPGIRDRHARSSTARAPLELAGGRHRRDRRRRPRRLRGAARARPGAAAPATPGPTRAPRLVGAGGAQPARRPAGGAGARPGHRDPARPRARLRHARDGGRAATSRSAAARRCRRYSFHGRGTLNGVIPHPALVRPLRGGGRRRRRPAPARRRRSARSPTSATSSSWAPTASPASTSASRSATRTQALEVVRPGRPRRPRRAAADAALDAHRPGPRARSARL